MAPDGTITAQFTADGGPDAGGSVTAETISVDANAAALGFLSADATTVGDMALLYSAFDRAPDLAGLTFWSLSGLSGERVAQFFVELPEGQALFSAASNGDFLEALYQGIFDRASDAGGKAFFLDQLDNGTTRAQVLAEMAMSPEHRQMLAEGLALGSATTQGEGWFAGSGDDRLTGGAGDDRLVGGDGTDTVVYAGDHDAVTITPTGLGVTVTGSGGTDTLIGIEQLQFDDGLLLIGRSTALDTAHSLYEALLGRQGEIGGLQYWGSLIDSGVSVGQVAAAMLALPEGVAQAAERQAAGWTPANAYEAELFNTGTSLSSDPAVLDTIVAQHLPGWQALIGSGYFYEGVA